MSSASARYSSSSDSVAGLPAKVLVSRLAVVSLVVLFLVITTMVFLNAITWIGKPFPGFLINGRKVAVDYGQYYWTGKQAGVKYPDKLIQAGATRIESDGDLEGVLQRTPIGDSVAYTFDREGELIIAEVGVMRFSLADFFATFGIEFVSGLLYLALGLIVFILKPDTHLSWAHFSACYALGLYVMCGFDMVSSHRLVPFYYFINAWVPAGFAHLGLVFPHRWRVVQKYPFIVAVPYIVSGLCLIPMAVYYPGPRFLLAYQFIHLFTLVSALALVSSACVAFLMGKSVLERQRAKVVLFGAALAFPIPVFFYIAPFVGHAFQSMTINSNFLVLALLIFPSSVAYAISKHNLFDVDVYIKRAVGYVLMTAVVAGGYFVLQSTVKAAILDPLLGRSAEQVYPFLFTLLTVFAFNPVSRKVQEGVDKLFFRKGVDFKATVAGVSESLTSMVDVQAFIETIIHTVRTDLFIDRAGVVLLDERTNTCRSTFHGSKFGIELDQAENAPDPCFAPQDPLLILLAQEKKLITKYDVAEDSQYISARERCGQRFEELGASVAFPLFYRDQFAGALALGYKKSGHFYTREDIDLLKTLSTMTSTAIEQSREKGQKAVLMQLFSKHVSPQVAESLWEQREQFLEGGRPKSQSMIVTAMFTDLQGFSTISEKQTPEVLMNWLNTYLEMMTTTVMEHGGVVDDFFGDGVKINFGVPIPRETEGEIRQDAINAVTCALAMEKKMIVLNGRMAAEGQQPLRMRIGLYTGPVVAGSLGSAERMKYTTIGDTVNTAARLESFDKDLVIARVTDSPCRILIGESTLRHVEGLFEVEKIGELSLKGKTERIDAYCVLGVGSGGSVRMTQGVGHVGD